MGEDEFVIKVNVQNKDNNVKVEKKTKEVKESELKETLMANAKDVIKMINK